jgi:hypothetical protein
MTGAGEATLRHQQAAGEQEKVVRESFNIFKINEEFDNWC